MTMMSLNDYPAGHVVYVYAVLRMAYSCIHSSKGLAIAGVLSGHCRVDGLHFFTAWWLSGLVSPFTWRKIIYLFRQLLWVASAPGVFNWKNFAKFYVISSKIKLMPLETMVRLNRVQIRLEGGREGERTFFSSSIRATLILSRSSNGRRSSTESSTKGAPRKAHSEEEDREEKLFWDADWCAPPSFSRSLPSLAKHMYTLLHWKTVSVSN